MKFTYLTMVREAVLKIATYVDQILGRGRKYIYSKMQGGGRGEEFRNKTDTKTHLTDSLLNLLCSRNCLESKDPPPVNKHSC